MYIRIVFVLFLAAVSGPYLLPTAFGQEKGPVEKGEQERELGLEDKKPLTKEKEQQKEPSVMHISPLKEEGALYSIELRNIDIGDFFRVVAHDYKLNIVVDKNVKGAITASFTNIELQEALDKIAEMNNLILEKERNIITVRRNLITRMFRLQHISVSELLGIAAVGGAGDEAGAPEGGEVPEAVPPAGQENQQGQEAQGASTSTIHALLSEDGKILLGTQLNSIIVIDYPPNVAKIEEFVKAVDQKLNTEVIKLNYISVKDLFPELIAGERAERKKQRDERQEERDELKELRETPASAGGN